MPLTDYLSQTIYSNDMIFSDRKEAGQLLTQVLKEYTDKDTVLYALPRGGVVVAAEIAKGLAIPLDVLIVRKLGHPQNPEYAVGAVGETGQLAFNEMEKVTIPTEWLENEIAEQKKEIRRRQLAYRDGHSFTPATEKVAIIVDDGIATGLTMEAAVKEIKSQQPKKLIIAVPVAPPDVAQILESRVDKFIALEIPEDFLGAVGAYYQYFPQITDKEVINLLHQHNGT